MNAQATRRGVPAVALWGGLGAIAWAAIALLTGGSSAQADDGADTPLGGVSSLVSQTVSSVGQTATAVAQPIVNVVVAPVVTVVVAPATTPTQHPAPAAFVEEVTDTVAAVPVVGGVTGPVVDTDTDTVQAADTVQAVVAPVTEVLQEAPVSQTAKPVQDAVAALPLVGGLVDRLGVLTLLDDVVGVLDSATAIVGGIVENTLPPVLTALDPAIPLTPGSGSVTAVAAASAMSAPALEPTDGIRAFSAPHQPTAVPGVPAPSAPSSEGELRLPDAPLGGPLAPSSSAASGGASVLSHARISDVGVLPLCAVERNSGSSDDVLPTSSVADTDVSPD